MQTNTQAAGDPRTWKLRFDSGQGYVVVQTQNGSYLVLAIQAPIEPGDETVPAKVSASQIPGTIMAQKGYEHQASYQNTNALAFTVYSVVQVVKQVIQKG
jgi:hypothetical protein